MRISFDQVWDKIIIPLEGKIVYTLEDRNPNKILKVSHDALTRDSQKDTKSQLIPRAVFEAIYNYIMENGEISRIEINQVLPHRYSSIVCAVLAKAPNIGFDLKPIRLYKK